MLRHTWFIWIAASLLLGGCRHQPITPIEVDMEGWSGGSTALELRSGLMVTTASVKDGEGVMREIELVLDLGSNLPVSLSKDDLARASHAMSGETVSFRNAMGTRLVAKKGTLDELSLAGLTFQHVNFIEERWDENYAPPVKLGVLGWQMIAKTRATIDLDAGRLLLAPARADRACDGVPVRTTRAGVVVDVVLEKGGAPVEAILDTAATATIVTSKKFAGGGRVALVQANGKELEVEMGERVYVEKLRLPHEILIGVPFFQAQRVTLDLKRGCLEIEGKSL